MLTALALTCVRGGHPLFRGVGFELPRGHWLHVRGANGAGKTSLMRMLAGLARPDEGEARWQGEPVASEACRRELLYLGHRAAVKDDLTPLENLHFAAAIDGLAPDDAQARAALAAFGLAGREDLAVRHLSAGQKRRVLLARLLTRNAAIWILDEPYTALDAKAADFVTGLVARHLEAGGLAVIASHQPIALPPGQAVDL